MRRALAIYLALCLSVMPAFAKDKDDSVPPGNWGAVESLKKGTSISLRMVSGDKMAGKLLGLDAVGIRLMVDNKERSYPRSGVAEVWQHRVPDRKLNGILYGMAAGAGVGIPIAAANGAYSKGGDTAGKQIAAAFAPVCIGIGALLGFTVDVMVKGDKLLYRK